MMDDSLGGFGDVEDGAPSKLGKEGGGARVGGSDPLELTAPSDRADVEVYDASKESAWS